MYHSLLNAISGFGLQPSIPEWLSLQASLEPILTAFQGDPARLEPLAGAAEGHALSMVVGVLMVGLALGYFMRQSPGNSAPDSSEVSG